LLHDPSFFKDDPTTALCRGDAEVEAESVAEKPEAEGDA